ncbi:hypothetical protein TRIUR3_11288 [Triticum urartu]|uniref:Uncharacterized protein n=1 Tax=Triticum urartu TaxID=4572 RepID=M7ZY96_TRIUA|nr:hypothetical protein TRIUR3_11288 [Triticum urartu]
MTARCYNEQWRLLLVMSRQSCNLHRKSWDRPRAQLQPASTKAAMVATRGEPSATVGNAVCYDRCQQMLQPVTVLKHPRQRSANDYNGAMIAVGGSWDRHGRASAARLDNQGHGGALAAMATPLARSSTTMAKAMGRWNGIAGMACCRALSSLLLWIHINYRRISIKLIQSYCQDSASLQCLTEEGNRNSEEINTALEPLCTWEMDDPDEAFWRSTATQLSCSQSRRCRHPLDSYSNGTARDSDSTCSASY